MRIVVTFNFNFYLQSWNDLKETCWIIYWNTIQKHSTQIFVRNKDLDLVLTQLSSLNNLKSLFHKQPPIRK